MISDKSVPAQVNVPARREFLKVAGAAFMAIPAVSAGQTGRSGPRQLSTFGVARADDFDLLDATISQLADRMADGSTTSFEIVEKYLGRISALDRQGPMLRHIIEVNPDAMAIAAGLDRERNSGLARGPLHGIPILLKDNIATGDRMTATAGSLAMAGARSSRDAFLAGRLRAAGAVLLGKTNMSEWANFRSTRSSSGWSSRGGQGRNPYVLDRSPCGSSSGTGGAISANYAVAGIGTETDGSITCPAATVGLVGIKPTVGLVSRSGIIPISVTQDTAGPMARTVTDAAILLTALAGVADPLDPATAPSARLAGIDYTRSLQPEGLKGARLGVVRKVFTGYNDATDRLFEQALEVMRLMGAVLVDPADVPHAGEYDAAEFTVLLYEFKAGLNAYLAELGPTAPVHSLQEVIAFNDREQDRVMPYFAQEIMHQAQAKGSLGALEYRRARATCRRLSRVLGIDAVMNRLRLDALVAPTGNPAWPIDLVNGDHFTGSVTTPAAVAGYPHITVPGGFVQELPVGISFFGRAWSEPTLLRVAYGFEQATRHRRPPGFLPSINAGAGTDRFRGVEG